MSSRNSSEISSGSKTEEKESGAEDVTITGDESRSPGETEKAKPTEDSKDGGFDAWLNVLGTHLVYISTWGLITAYGAYATYFTTGLLEGYSATDIAWPGTLQAVLIIAVGVISGPLFDKGYIRSLLFVGSFMVVFGMMMLSLSSQYYQIVLAQGVCVGIGSGMVYVPSLALVSVSFKEHRALALATVTSGAAIGGVVYPIALQRLLPLVGFGWATRILGFMTLFTFVLGIPLVLWNGGEKFKPTAARSFFDATALKEPPFVAFCAAMFLVFLAYYVPFFFIPDFAQSVTGASTDFSVYLLAITNAATFPSRFLSAISAKAIGPLNTLVICTFASAIVLLSWLGVHSLAGLDVWCLSWGITAGPLVTIPAAIVPQLSPDPGLIGTRMGMIWLCAAMGGLVGAPVAGVLNKPAAMDFVGSQSMVGAAMAVATLLLVMVWIGRRGWSKKS